MRTVEAARLSQQGEGEVMMLRVMGVGAGGAVMTEALPLDCGEAVALGVAETLKRVVDAEKRSALPTGTPAAIAACIAA
jgi:hypothetical protein